MIELAVPHETPDAAQRDEGGSASGPSPESQL